MEVFAGKISLPKKFHPEGACFHTIYCYQPDSYLGLAADLGAEKILKKPFLQTELMDVVEEVLA